MINSKIEGGLRTKGHMKKSTDKKPLISIVTVVYNGEKYLESTILSVINQSYENVEYIIVDGLSSDGTIEIIKKYESEIDYWISEKDSGIYDAWNKGLSLSTGDIIGILNADDWYNEAIFENVVNEFLKKKENLVYFGNMQMIGKLNKKLFIKPSSFNDLKNRMAVNHPTVFLSSDLYIDKIFDDSFRITADYEFFLYLYQLNKKIHLNIINSKQVITNMRIDGISDKLSSLFNVIREDYRARQINKLYLESIIYLIRDIVFKFPKKILKSVILNTKFDFILEKRANNKFK